MSVFLCFNRTLSLKLVDKDFKMNDIKVWFRQFINTIVTIAPLLSIEMSTSKIHLLYKIESNEMGNVSDNNLTKEQKILFMFDIHSKCYITITFVLQFKCLLSLLCCVVVLLYCITSSILHVEDSRKISKGEGIGKAP